VLAPLTTRLLNAAKCLHFLALHNGGQKSWHIYIGMKKLRHCHPMCTTYIRASVWHLSHQSSEIIYRVLVEGRVRQQIHISEHLVEVRYILPKSAANIPSPSEHIVTLYYLQLSFVRSDKQNINCDSKILQNLSYKFIYKRGIFL